MKRPLLTSGLVAAMLLVARAPFAETASLSWNDCAADGGTSNHMFACDSNLGGQAMVGTFQLTTPMDSVTGVAITLDLISADPVLPEWWHFKDVGSCRMVGASIVAHDGASCPDWAVGQASMNIAAYYVGQPRGVNTGRFRLLNAVPLEEAKNLVENQEYSLMRLEVNDLNTVGTGACAGCSNPVCIVLTYLQVDTKNNLDDRYLASTALGSMITWQGPSADCRDVPVRNATWGRVKSLYR